MRRDSEGVLAGLLEGKHSTTKRLNELMKVAVEIIAGSLFQDLTTCIKKDDFLRRHQSEPFKISNGWQLKPGNNDLKNEAGSRSNPPESN